MRVHEALDRRVEQSDFPVVFVLLDGQPAPGLPFLRQLHWVVTAEPASEKNVARLMDAASGGGAPFVPTFQRTGSTVTFSGLPANTRTWICAKPGTTPGGTMVTRTG